MGTSSLVIEQAEELAAGGYHAAVVERLGAEPETDLEASPSLALLYGTAQARLGRHDEGQRWIDLAVESARRQKEHALQGRALNARGALALVSGRADEAADYCTRALMVASLDGDLATIGRSSNNLGIVSHLRGRHAEAIGSWEIALAAFERAGWRQGQAESYHNLGISYREQGALARALAEADRSVEEAEAAGDHTLQAMTRRGRAEIYVARGELDLAQRELSQIREIRTRAPNPVDEAEDLRVEASVLAANGELAAAERTLRDVIGRAEELGGPQLKAEATRDLAMVLRRAGRTMEAQAAALGAKAIFSRLGADAEIRNLASQEWDPDFAAKLGRSLEPLHEAQELADAGRYAQLVTYLSGRPQDELEQSPMLALLFGIAHSRLGRLDLGRQWARVALSRARVLGDRKVEVRALNVCGAIALERGGLSEATHFFSEAQEEATRDNDMTTVGRCANNLGIIANMQGDYGRAVAAYTRAMAAYQQANNEQGIAEAQHNLGIAYRELGRLDDALRAADAAVACAERLGDPVFKAQTLAGRAEIQTARGDHALAIREAELALAAHRELKDAVRETEDLRIFAVAQGLAGKTHAAQDMLREVITRATEHGRPLLVAIAQRDLAQLLARMGELGDAKQLAHAARETFDRLGAHVEIQKLNALVAEPVPSR